jgi:transcriptional regulator GlxA family with amidase domain
MTDQDSLAAVKTYIAEHCSEAVTISQLAHMACMSPGKLKYSYKAAYHNTIYHSIMEARASRAERLLLTTDLPVSVIAEMVGYKKAGAFAAAFRKCKGKLPREVRRLQNSRTKIN